jgi:hypothetical protein
MGSQDVACWETMSDHVDALVNPGLGGGVFHLRGKTYCFLLGEHVDLGVGWLRHVPDVCDEHVVKFRVFPVDRKARLGSRLHLNRRSHESPEPGIDIGVTDQVDPSIARWEGHLQASSQQAFGQHSSRSWSSIAVSYVGGVMKRISLAVLILCVGLVSVAWGQQPAGQVH